MSDVEQRDSVRRDETRWLDGLKATALAWIVLNHVVEPIAGFPYIANPTSEWPPLSERVAQLAPLWGLGLWTAPANIFRYLGWFGDQGVQLFLIASGFGLMWAALRRPWQGWQPYLQRRSSRIYPLWWGVHIGLLALSVGVAVALGRFTYGISPTDWQFYASFAGIRFLPSTVYYAVGSWWFIGLVIQLYLVFPYMARWLRRIGPARFLTGVVVLGTLVRLAGLLAFDDLGVYVDPWSRGAIFITRVPEFALGMTLAVWFARRDKVATMRRLAHPLTLAAAGLTYVAATALSLTLVGNAISPFLLGLSAFVLLFALFRWLGTRKAPNWISTQSYGIYLTHQTFVLIAVEAAAVAGLSVALTGVGIAGAIVASAFAAVGLQWLIGFLQRVWRVRGPRRILTWTSAVIGFVMIVAIAGELTVQRYAPQEVLGWGERPALTKDDDAGWRLRADTETRLRWEGYDYETSSNALGFPGPNPSSNDKTVRIVTIGDAFTSAEGVDTDKAWPRVVERGLSGGGQAYDVVNLAITGYGPEQYASVAEKHLPSLSPDVVVVALFVNDYLDVEWSKTDFQESIGFGRPDPFGSLATLQLSHSRKLARGTLVAPIVAAVTGEPDPHGYFLGNFAALERDAISRAQELAVEEHLQRVAAVASASEAEVLVLQIPAPIQVCGPADLAYYPDGVDFAGNDFDLDAPQRITQGIADRIGARSYDLRRFLNTLPDCPYFSFNMHWPESTHEAVGEHVVGLLNDWALLGPHA